MLVISRRAGESIVIGEGIEIEVLEPGPTRVKLGIKASKDIAVIRKEVQVTQDQNRAAAREIPLALLSPVLKQLGPAGAPSAKTRSKPSLRCR